MRWSYALNQWQGGHDRFVLRAEHERAFRTIAVCGFEGVEIPAGTGRWEPLGRKDWMCRHYGSVEAFRATLHECGLRAVSSYCFDPASPIFEEGSMGRSVLDATQHAAIADGLMQYAELLQALGGDTLVVRALPDWHPAGDLTRDSAHVAAQCWNVVGRRVAEHGVRLALAVGCTSMAHTAEHVAMLMDACDDSVVGLSIDTADAVIAGIDPVQLLRRMAGRVSHVQLQNTCDTDSLQEYRLPHPAKALLTAGGERGIERWYWELGEERGLVDVVGCYQELLAQRYEGWIVIESEHSPVPASSAMLNAWFVQHRLLPLCASAR